jgi:hypothetical protein
MRKLASLLPSDNALQSLPHMAARPLLTSQPDLLAIDTSTNMRSWIKRFSIEFVKVMIVYSSFIDACYDPNVASSDPNADHNLYTYQAHTYRISSRPFPVPERRRKHEHVVNRRQSTDSNSHAFFGVDFFGAAFLGAAFLAGAYETNCQLQRVHINDRRRC